MLIQYQIYNIWLKYIKNLNILQKEIESGKHRIIIIIKKWLFGKIVRSNRYEMNNSNRIEENEYSVYKGSKNVNN